MSRQDEPNVKFGSRDEMSREDYERGSNNYQNWLIYHNLKQLQQRILDLVDKYEAENKSEKDCCSCDEIRKIIKEEISKLPNDSNKPSQNYNWSAPPLPVNASDTNCPKPPNWQKDRTFPDSKYPIKEDSPRIE